MARIVRWEGLRDEREMRSLEMSTCLCVLVLWGPMGPMALSCSSVKGTEFSLESQTACILLQGMPAWSLSLWVLSYQ